MSALIKVFRRVPIAGKILTIAVAVLCLLIAGATNGARRDTVAVSAAPGSDEGTSGSAPSSPVSSAATSARPAPSAVTPTTDVVSVAAPVPVLSVETRTELAAVAFSEVMQDDTTLDAGTTAVAVEGRAGQRSRTYEVTLTDGVETGRSLVSDEVVQEPIDRVVLVGTRESAPAPSPAPVAALAPAEPLRAAAGGDCDPNYDGACVPVASDVDCAGGSGNGPEYVAGPVQVIGSDIYGLDRDADGVGCE